MAPVLLDRRDVRSDRIQNSKNGSLSFGFPSLQSGFHPIHHAPDGAWSILISIRFSPGLRSLRSLALGFVISPRFGGLAGMAVNEGQRFPGNGSHSHRNQISCDPL